jgi:hypothetical protein
MKPAHIRVKLAQKKNRRKKTYWLRLLTTIITHLAITICPLYSLFLRNVIYDLSGVALGSMIAESSHRTTVKYFRLLSVCLLPYVKLSQANLGLLSWIDRSAVLIEVFSNIFGACLFLVKNIFAVYPQVQPKFRFRCEEAIPVEIIGELCYRDIKAGKCCAYIFRCLSLLFNSWSWRSILIIVESVAELVQYQPQAALFRPFCPPLSVPTLDHLLVLYSFLQLVLRFT